METKSNSNEGNTPQGIKKTETAYNSDNGVQYEAPLAVRQAYQARQGIDEGLVKVDEKISQLNELMARAALGGQSYAGQPQEQKKPMTNAEYAKMVMSGKIPPKE